MARNRPWYKRSGQDFVMGVIHFPDNDHRYAYSAIVDMLNDRDRPLPDDPQFICGFAGLTKQKWRKVRDYLLTHGYLVQLEDGTLSNPRFEAERAERQGQHEKAVEAGREGGKKSAAMRAGQAGQQDLPLEQNGKPPRNLQESRQETSKKVASLSEVSGGRTLKTNDKVQAPPQPSRAREEAESIELPNKQTSITTSAQARARTPAPARAREGSSGAAHPPPDRSAGRSDHNGIEDLTLACCEAGGLEARSRAKPELWQTNADIVANWKASGIDIRKTAVPAIRAQLKTMEAPAGSLAAFSAAVDHAHASGRRGANRKDTSRRKRSAPPPEPVFQFADEDAGMVAFRQELAEAIPSYPNWCSDIRLERVDWREDGDLAFLAIHSRDKRRDWTVRDLFDRNQHAFNAVANRILGAEAVAVR